MDLIRYLPGFSNWKGGLKSTLVSFQFDATNASHKNSPFVDSYLLTGQISWLVSRWPEEREPHNVATSKGHSDVNLRQAFPWLAAVRVRLRVIYPALTLSWYGLSSRSTGVGLQDSFPFSLLGEEVWRHPPWQRQQYHIYALGAWSKEVAEWYRVLTA